MEQDGLKVTLFLRRATRLQHLQSDRIDIVEGDACSVSDLTSAIRGQEIVISAMGGMDLDVKVKNIVTAMKVHGAAHIVVISAGGIYDELPPAFNAWDKGIVGGYRPINLKAAQTAEESGLAFTILRPVWLTDDATEEFQLTQRGEAYKGTETSRASIGRFVAELVNDPSRYAKANLGISQPNTDGDRPAAYR